MKTSEFLVFRNRLHKTPSQLAQLLGVSEQLVHTYETGEIQISEEHEGRLYFLLSRMLSEDVARQPCWKIKNCSNEKKLNCPAWEFQSGRICWLINGTVCEENQNKPWPEKWKTCRECPVIESIAHPAKRHPIQMAEVAFQDNVISQFEQIVGKDPKMQVVYRLIEDVAITNTTVMVQGESGTGKELVARAIHRLSPRKDNPFIVINCSAFPETLLESELFGHEKGAFTGATKTRAGRFEQADKGTIFLDEINKLPVSMQGKLLQFLDGHRVRQIGSNTEKTINVRIICASKGDLKQQAESAFFLEDLYYRISDFPLYIPPLRDRHKDIRLLAHHFITRFARETQVDVPGYTPSFMDALVSYEWPGNVRELEKCIKRAMVLMRSGDTLHQECLPSNVAESGRGFVDGDLITPLRETLGEVECREISRALKRTGGNKSQASRILGISYPNLLKKIRLYGLIRR